MLESTLPDYTEVKNALNSATATATVTPSESHGLLVGLFCSGKIAQVNAEKWARSSLVDVECPEQSAVDTLMQLFQVTKEKLDKMDFSFQILLPDDEKTLAKRAEELGVWCNSFIKGLRLGGVDLQGDYSEDCSQAMQRISEIAEIDYEHCSISEADENAYIEIVEYVRLAILIVYTDIARKKARSEGASGASTILH